LSYDSSAEKWLVDLEKVGEKHLKCENLLCLEEGRPPLAADPESEAAAAASLAEEVSPARDLATATSPVQGRPALVEGAPGEYRVMQGPLFKKPGSDPATPKVTQVKPERQVNSRVMTTGRIWTGPSGGEWVELDPASETRGWLLVEGPGFGMPGPLLEKVEPDEEDSLRLFVLSPLDDSRMFDISVKPSQTVRHVKNWIATRRPWMSVSKITCAQEKPSSKTHGMGLRNFPANWIIEDRTKIGETPFKDGMEFVFLYMGDAEADLREYEERRKEAAAANGSSAEA